MPFRLTPLSMRNGGLALADKPSAGIRNVLSHNRQWLTGGPRESGPGALRRYTQDPDPSSSAEVALQKRSFWPNRATDL